MLQHLLDAPFLDLRIDLLRHDKHPSNSKGCGIKPGALQTATLSADLIDNKPGALPAKGASGHPLARSLLRRWWCDANVTVLLMSRGHQALGVVHTGRTLTGQERTASLAQADYRCAGLGCCPGLPDPLKPLVPHHLVMHSLSGTTSTDDNAWICEQFHHDLHSGKRTLQLRDGRWINESGIVPNPHDQPSIWD